MKKHVMLALLLIVALLALGACSEDTTQTAAPTVTATPEVTEEPVVEPTEEPEAEPTEEPVVEPAAQSEEEEPEAEPAAQSEEEEPEVEPAAQFEEEEPEAEPVAQSEEETDPVLASAYEGAVTITLSEIQQTYDDLLDLYVSYYTQYGYSVDEYDTTFQDSVAQDVVYSEISQRVVMHFAQENGYVLTEERDAELFAEAQTTMDSIREYYESYISYYGYEGEELAQIVDEELTASGYSVELLYENAKLADALEYIADIAATDVTVTEDEVREAFDAKVQAAMEEYDADVDAFIDDYLSGADILYTPENVRLLECIFIVRGDEDDVAEADEATPAEADEATPAEADEATAAEADEATPAEPVDWTELSGRKKAEAVLAQIRAGADFEAVMVEANEDDSTEEELLSGYPVAEGSVLYGDDFINAALALENVGDISDVVETDYGYFIFKYAQDLTAGAADLEPRLEEETETLLETKKGEAYTALVDTVLDEADIQMPDLSPLYHIFVSETVEATIAYASVTEATELTDMPFGDAVATLAEGASLDVLGHIGVDGETFAFVAVPGTEIKGYVNEAALADLDEEAALAVDNSALVASIAVEGKNPTFTIAMNDGSLIYGELYPDIAPDTVGNFVALANANFYDGLIFHRVVPGFVIQGGDPNGDGTGGPGYSIRGEFTNNGVENNLSHVRGVLSMARSSAMDSAGSQFFIMHADNDYLDGDYAAFGMVLGGIETVDVIASVPTNSSSKPMTDQTMRTVYVETYGQTYTFTKLED